jgi:uncharacterized membrane protein
MNKGLYIVLVPVLLVAVGYVFILRYAGLSPGYLRLIIAAGTFFVIFFWLARRKPRKTPSL